ncbi:hypothetical protein EMIHUDRAFT_438939 [Emiliania huxleyi CCMP1516]|uniref:Uncharacterized protein n=2 Tax=Emiliania huxleyi TaxID=2903 RepID=A0A0D3I2U3_EMIH1|nr:hypothetical protein EMIHUDRAFT_438939 [Emiliania huxleyi CCMP1516]EOD05578.1 hypothetical protein EMIHUDRAFT_438939 [Emiliania huxleyi CCMP1516]|eukprot:XP_005758007.1 hypothetical protein EMIHUDRAFT_438939 [Emiliania huxleyi CCMP1516]
MPARSLEAAAAERRRVRRLATLAAKQLPPPRRDAASAEEREPARRSPTPPSSCVPLLGCTTALRGSSISSRRTATRLAPVAAGREHAVAAVVPRAGARLSYSRAAPRRSADTHRACRARRARLEAGKCAYVPRGLGGAIHDGRSRCRPMNPRRPRTSDTGRGSPPRAGSEEGLSAAQQSGSPRRSSRRQPHSST